LFCVPPIAVVAVNASPFVVEKNAEWPAAVISALVVLGVYLGLVSSMSREVLRLGGMRERTRFLGGPVQITLKIDEGSRIVVDLPLATAADEP
jgi:glucose-6-phosphate-specific signal transduction histidine kinase